MDNHNHVLSGGKMRFLIGMILTFFLWGTSLAGMVSVAIETATLNSLPSESSAYVVLHVPLYYPFDVLETRDDFHKVRDFSGKTGWIHRGAVNETESVVVRATSVNVRKGPGMSHGVGFMAKRGVAFKVLSHNDGWLEVLHEEGRRGWVSQTTVWGFHDDRGTKD